MRRRRGQRIGVLANHRQVIEDPERAPFGGGDQVAVAHLEVGHRDNRKIAGEELPPGPAVVRDVDRGLGPGVHQPLPLGILAHHAHRLAGAQPVHQRRPRLAEVGGAVDVRRRVAHAVLAIGHVHRARVVRRHLELVHQPIARRWRRHVGPRRPAVLRQLHVAVVGAHVHRLRIVRRLLDHEDRPVHFAARPFIGDRAAAPPLAALVVLRQVPRGRRPRLSAITRAQQHVAAVVNHVLVVHRHHDGCRPVEAVFRLVGRLRQVHLRVRHDVARQPVLLVQLVDEPLVAAPVHITRALPAHADVGTLAPRAVVPLALGDHEAVGARLDDHRRVVLLSRVELVRKVVVDRHVVELRRRLVVLRAPALPAIQRDRAAAVVGVRHVVAVGRVDPEAVVVAVHRVHHRKRPPAVDRLEHRCVHHPHHVGVLRIGDDIHVVPRACLDQAILAQQAPALPRVVAAVQPSLLGLDDRIDAFRICRRDRHVEVSDQLGEPFGEALPAVAAIGRLPDPAPGTAGAHHPRRTLVVPHRRVQDARVGRVHRQPRRAAGRVLPLEHLQPRLAAVGRAVDPALRRSLPSVALRRDVDDVRVVGMHPHGRDLARGGEPHVDPRLPLVGTLVDAVAVGRRLPADRMLAAPHVDHVGVGRGDRDGADGARLEEAVGDVAPRQPGVVGAPEPASGVADEVRQRLRRDPDDGVRASSARRPDVTPRDRLKDARVEGGDGRRSGRGRCAPLRFNENRKARTHSEHGQREAGAMQSSGGHLERVCWVDGRGRAASLAHARATGTRRDVLASCERTSAT